MPSLVHGVAVLILLPCVQVAHAQGGTRRVSLGDTGQEGQGDSTGPSLDFSGRRVAFGSLASNLLPDDSGSLSDLFVHDLVTGALQRVSVDLAGGPPDSYSQNPALSDDGTRVAFESNASDLVPGDGNARVDVYLRDLESEVTLRVSLAHDGAEPDNHCFAPSIAADGRRVAFESRASNLATVPDGNGDYDVFVRDLEQGWIRCVSLGHDGGIGDGDSRRPSLSADGRWVAFQSASNAIVQGDSNGAADIFVHDLETGRTRLVSLAWDGSQGDGDCHGAVLTADGSKVLFESYANNLVPGGAGGKLEVYLRDLQTGAVTRVSEPQGGGFPDGHCVDLALSRDGRYQLFRSYAANLIPGDVNGQPDLFLRDALSGTLERVNLSSLDQPLVAEVHRPALSGDGRVVGFATSDASVVPFDLNGDSDVFVRERWAAAPTVASYCTPSATSIAGCQAVLQGSGVPSLGAASGFTLASGPVPGGALGLLRFGVHGPAALPIGTLGGLDCVAAVQLQAPAMAAGGTPGLCDGGVDHTLADLAAAQPAAIAPGATVHAQLWLRDGANPDGFALSSGVWFQVLP